jgi:serine protease AprX
MGVAPECLFVGVKILDAAGRGNASDVLAGLQWIVDNRERYNIRVANLSIGASDAGSSDPLVRAVEYAWDSGVIVNIAAGNNGPAPGSVTSPGISRKAITVGAYDDNKPTNVWGARLVNFSGRGPTSECIVKPDILAAGEDVVSCLSNSPEISPKRRAELRLVNEYYVKMSGTSMATPIISGAIALLLEKYPRLKPDDVKYLIKKSAKPLDYSKNRQGWGAIDISELLNQEGFHVR